jgi:hypothetical protein
MNAIWFLAGLFYYFAGYFLKEALFPNIENRWENISFIVFWPLILLVISLLYIGDSISELRRMK